jgi:DtxR family Mn-dependent transcriptional regulator
MEHALSSEETDELAARLGHPAWDPHGDPIPTSGGELPSVERATLSTVEPGRAVEIIHVEDEPREIYDALLEDGLDVGARVEVLGRDDQRVQVRSRGRDWSIDRLVAGNVTVRRLAEGERADAAVATLMDLPVGDSARVLGISPACKGSQRRRLLDLGVVRGTVIGAVFRSAGGDPIAYRIRGALIALRKEQAEWVRDELLSEDDGAGERGEGDGRTAVDRRGGSSKAPTQPESEEVA